MKKPASRLNVERDSESGKITTIAFDGKDMPAELRNKGLSFMETGKYRDIVTIVIKKIELHGMKLSDIPSGLRIISTNEKGRWLSPEIISWSGYFFAYFMEFISELEDKYMAAFLKAIKQREQTLNDVFLDATYYNNADGVEGLLLDYHFLLDKSLSVSEAMRYGSVMRQEIEALAWQIAGQEPPPSVRRIREPIGMFLSHSWRDKAFARRLATDLQAHGIKVWLDEAEMLPGDSLFKKLEQAIYNMDYLCVILSPNSVDSEWARREVEIALHEEIQGKRVKVIPLLYKKCNVPSFLQSKIYADCMTKARYKKAIEQLARRAREDEMIT